MIGDLVTHVVVSTVILALALAAAAWIRPLTARTRHAILIAGMAALALPAPLLAKLLERNDIAPLPRLNVIATMTPRAVAADGLKPAATSADIVMWIWVGVAALLLLRWWIITDRLIRTATRAGTPPPRRTIEALAAARRRLALHRSVDLIASPTCEAPAVVRVLRPMIILPADGCDSLDDEELESLLCHECAHVARRDNLLGVFEAVVCSLFWFNPLVWLAHRRIAAAREAACDERVADAALPAGTYAGALAKVCRTLLAPRIAAVSCMASAHLKERIQHLMRYDTLRKSAFPHKLVTAAASAVVVLSLLAGAVVTAQPKSELSVARYLFNYSLGRNDNGELIVRGQIVESETQRVFAEPTLVTRPGVPVSTEITREGVQMRINVAPDTSGGGRIELVAREGDTLLQQTSYQLKPERMQREQAYSGDRLSLSLHDADLKDVLGMFAKLTGLEITSDPDVQGKVTMEFKDTPWDEALDRVIKDAGYTYRLQGKNLHVFKP